MGERLTIPGHLARGPRRSEDQATDEAVWLIDHLCSSVGLADLGDAAVLDYGCGVRFTQAFLNRGLPIGRYVGVDVARDLVQFLQQNVDDPRFEFHWIDTHNDRYNPDGERLTPTTPLPLDERFDVICLYSVLTHLAPDDTAALLALLRRYVAPDGHLLFSIFLDDGNRESGGLMDRIAQRTEPLPVAPFRDLLPDEPLKWAVYSEPYARELVTAAGWTVARVGLPVPPYIQHHLVCAPA